jgi:hypothetical protein
MKSLGRDNFRGLVILAEVLSVAGDQIVGLRSLGAFIESVIGFVSGNLEDVSGQNLHARVTDDGQGICDSFRIELEARPTGASSYSAKIAGETNLRIFLLAAKSRMAAEGPSSIRLADTTTLVSITTLIICWNA